jgi:TRAP-type transport system periplasmic protein
MRLSPILAPITVAAALAIAPAAAADYLLDFSLETGPNHIRNIAVEAFAKAIAEESKGRLEIRVFHGASQYKDAAVPTALGQGALDMGAPGTWQLGRFVPEYNVPELPMFYGTNREVIYALLDGEIGQALNRRLEEKLNIKVIGRYFDLGFGSLFFSETEVTGLDQLDGMKLRSPGGAANVKRLQVFGANPVTIPWPDVPQALQRGQRTA